MLRLYLKRWVFLCVCFQCSVMQQHCNDYEGNCIKKDLTEFVALPLLFITVLWFWEASPSLLFCYDIKILPQTCSYKTGKYTWQRGNIWCEVCGWSLAAKFNIWSLSYHKRCTHILTHPRRKKNISPSCGSLLLPVSLAERLADMVNSKLCKWVFI